MRHNAVNYRKEFVGYRTSVKLEGCLNHFLFIEQLRILFCAEGSIPSGPMNFGEDIDLK